MSKQLISAYSYNTAAKTVTLTDFTTVRLDRLQLITNTTTNQIIYNFADSSVATASVSGNVITLSAAPGSNTDKLMIIYDCLSGDPVYDGYKELASLSAGSLNADLVPSTDVSGYKTAALQLVGSSAVLTLSFQVSNDNTNWILWDAMSNQVGANPKWSSTNVNPATGSFVIPLAFRYLRVRATSYTSGSVTGTLELHTQPMSLPSTQATQSGTWTVGSNAASGSAVPTNVFPIGVSDPIGNLTTLRVSSNYGDGTTLTQGLPTNHFLWNGTNYDRWRSSGPTGTAAVAGSFTEVPFTTTVVANLASTDVSAYKSVSVHIVSQGTGSTVTFQQSNDNTNWVPLLLTDSSAASTQGTIRSNTGSAGVIYQGPLNSRYFRLAVTGISALTTAGVIEFYTSPAAPTGLTVTNPSGTNIGISGTVGSNSATGSAVPANAFLMGMTDGTLLRNLQTQSNTGDSSSAQNTLAVGMNFWNGGSYDRIRSATSAAGTTGTGVPAAGMLGFDGTNYQRILTGTDGKVYTRIQDGFGNNIAQVTPGDALSAAPTTVLGVSSHNLVYNNTNYERQRSAAIGDGVVTTGIAASVPYLINGASGGVDRQRGNWNGTTGDTGAKTASFTGVTQTNYNAAGANIVINMGAVSGTTPTLTAQVQGSADGGTTWFNITGAVTPSINATGVTVLTVYPGVSAVANASVPMNLPRTWRLNYTIGGTTPSFTITNVQVAYNN
jgi:hypothetical protein